MLLFIKRDGRFLLASFSTGGYNHFMPLIVGLSIPRVYTIFTFYGGWIVFTVYLDFVEGARATHRSCPTHEIDNLFTPDGRA